MPGVLRSCAMLLLAAALGPAGCGPRNFANENDVLRARVLDQEREIEQLKLRNAELLAALAEAGDEAAMEVHASAPQVARIAIGRWSEALDTDGDGVIDTVVVYIEPSDGRGRFLQLTGSLSVHAALLPADREAITLGRVELSPPELRDAYRSGFAGTHYTIEVPITMPADMGGARSCQVHVVFTDGRTGRVHEASRAIELPVPE